MTPTSLNGAQQALARDLDRLATLTADNPIQQGRIPALREALSRTVDSLNAATAARRAASARVGDRRTRGCKCQPDRRARDATGDARQGKSPAHRARAGRPAAVQRLQTTSIGVLIGAAGLLAAFLWLLSAGCHPRAAANRRT